MVTNDRLAQMIQIDTKPMTPAGQKEIRDWLNMAGSKALQAHLANKIAAAAALLANTELEMAFEKREGAEADLTEARTKVTRLVSAKMVLDEILGEDYDFPTSELKPMPLNPS